MVHYYLQLFLKGSAYILVKLVIHSCVPFQSGAPLTFFVHPSVHRAHRLKSTELEYSEAASDFKNSFLAADF